MSNRRFVICLLGMWLAGSLFLAAVASYNFRAVEQVLAAPPRPAAKTIDTLGPDSARMLLRYQVSELNRAYFEYWGLAQLALGTAVFALLLFGTSEGKWAVALSLVAVLIAVVQRFLLTPDLVNYGRQLDFSLNEARVAERARLAALHGAYSGAELFKWALMFGVLGLLIRRGERKRRSVRKIHPVDNADHPHVQG
ncbi:MAG: hypothetical protein HY822_14720 [Acidobacteria bacterium]|nr:hypothetical protein [Acidobacteriota bacterium]